MSSGKRKGRRGDRHVDIARRCGHAIKGCRQAVFPVWRIALDVLISIAAADAAKASGLIREQRRAASARVED